jgi:hypothetical protein
MKQQIIALSIGFFQIHYVLQVVKTGVRQHKINNTFNTKRIDVSSSGNL